MKKGLVIGLACVGVFVLTFGILTATEYNSLVTINEDVAGEKANIVVSLESRDSLIGQLVTTAGTYLNHESDVYKMITDARADFADAVSTNNYAEIIAADNATSVALSNLLALVEDTPELSSDTVIISLMGSMETLEFSLKVARRDYNDAVEEFNTKIKLFPRVLFAKMFGYDEPKPYWEATSGGDIEVTFPDA
jgi:LemA protein